MIRSDVIRTQGHGVEEIERRVYPGVDGRRLPILEDRCRLFCSEALRRDRAVSSRSELTSVALGDERREQLPFADAPLRRSAHDLLDQGVERCAEEGGPVLEGLHDVDGRSPGEQPDHRELRLRAQPTAASYRLETHQDDPVASRTAARPASRRSRAAPKAAEMVTSNTSS